MFLLLLWSSYMPGYGGEFFLMKRCSDWQKDYVGSSQTPGKTQLCDLEETTFPLKFSLPINMMEMRVIYPTELVRVLTLSTISDTWRLSSLASAFSALCLACVLAFHRKWQSAGTRHESPSQGGRIASFPLQLSLGHVIQEIISFFCNSGLN